ncbi:MAG: hypothetical protein COW12_01340 [Candidatus Omnitrophica bacterium CG12_big_fil_rev_8_21_14_0_65_45_16]|nr:MAG: hypothetical protein COW12_01340 [Candidatus Omnitrophica bacterium CG12_big_fil_rev_8_21_14_0_65_45_16]
MTISTGLLGNQWYLKNRLPCRWVRVDLQPRDVRLLKCLFEQKFLSREQIRDYLFDGRKRYCDDRVWKLRRFGWIEKLNAVFAGRQLYLATKAAYKFFCEQSMDVPQPFEMPDFRTISHDLLVTDIRFLFERIGFGTSWTSERVWRMGRAASKWAPDAVVHVGEDPFALEVECVRKTDERYRDIFWRYQEDRETVACFYVANESFLKSLLEQAKDFKHIYFTSTAELFEKKEKAVFTNAAGQYIAIEDNLEKNLSKADLPQQ